MADRVFVGPLRLIVLVGQQLSPTVRYFLLRIRREWLIKDNIMLSRKLHQERPLLFGKQMPNPNCESDQLLRSERFVSLQLLNSALLVFQSQQFPDQLPGVFAVVLNCLPRFFLLELPSGYGFQLHVLQLELQLLHPTAL